MDATTIAVFGVIFAILLIMALTLTKSGRKFMFEWQHKLFGTVKAEAENSSPSNFRAEQIVEDSYEIEQEMTGVSKGKQVAKNSQKSSQKIT